MRHYATIRATRRNGGDSAIDKSPLFDSEEEARRWANAWVEVRPYVVYVEIRYHQVEASR